MDEENSSKGNEKKFSRREILKGAAVLFGAAATGNLISGCSDNETSAQPSPIKIKTSTPPLAVPTSPPSPEVRPQVNLKDQTFFSGLKGENLLRAQQRVVDQITHYQNDPGLQNRINQSKKYSGDVNLCAIKLGFRPDSFVPPLLTSLIFVESAGNEKALSGDGLAKGLCQLTPDTTLAAFNKITLAERVALGIKATKVDELDLYDKTTNIALSLQILAVYKEWFPDPSLTLWCYHLGPKYLIGAMRAYISGHKLETDEDLNRILGNEAKPGTTELVIKHKLNFFTLIEDENVKLYFDNLKKKRESNLDDTEFYIPRLVAAGYFLTK